MEDIEVENERNAEGGGCPRHPCDPHAIASDDRKFVGDLVGGGVDFARLRWGEAWRGRLPITTWIVRRLYVEMRSGGLRGGARLLRVNSGFPVTCMREGGSPPLTRRKLFVRRW